MRLQWIDDQLEAREMSRRQLAESIPGLTESKMSLIMSGQRKLSADEADAIRRFFGYRMPDDPPRGPVDLVHDRIAKLSEPQAHAVILYLEALMGEGVAHQQAS